MLIKRDIELIEPYPAIYLRSLNSIVIADLHLGYEGIMAEQGVFLPKIQFKKEIEALEDIIDRKNAERIIILGDIKHEFSETSYHEFKEVRELFIFLKDRFEEIDLIKGNHDNYIFYVTKKYDINLHDELELGDYFLIHGHRYPSKRIEKFLILAHEHPAIAIYDEVGVKEKLKCFLAGENILVLPAFSYLAPGSEVNVIPKNEFLSPILKNIEIDKLEVFAISKEIGCLNFGKLKNLRI